MKIKYKLSKSFLSFSFFCLFLLIGNDALSQQNVFHRSDAGTGDWGSGNLPWFYQTSNNSQGDPDNGSSTRNDVFIGHNNNTTMSLNGRYYLHRDFTFQAGASSARTLNNTTGGGFSFNRSLINASTATHIFNTPVGIDANNAEIRLDNAAGGALTFNSNIFTNNNLVFIRYFNNNLGTITFNGTMSQGGSIVKQGAGILVFTGSADFSGSLFIDQGTLRVNRALSTNLIEIGGGVQLSTGFDSVLAISSGVAISKNITVKNFGTGSGSRTINFTHTSGTGTLSGTLALEKLVTIDNVSGNSGAIISGIVSGVGSIIKTGLGDLSLTNQNTYTGNTTVNAGTLQLSRTGGNTIPSSNSVNINGGTLRVSSNQTLSNLTLTSGGLTIDSGVTLTLSGNPTIPNGFTITNNGTLVIEGNLTDNRTTKSFSGTVRYAGANQNIVNASYNNLELSGSGTKTFANNTTINGNFTVTGVSVTAPTTLTFGGASAQNIAGINYNNIVFSGNGNKTFTSNAQVSSASNITFGSGNGTIDFDGASNNLVFTFKSDVNSTAVIGNIGSFALSGNVTTERYTKSRRAFRFLTSSVTTTSTINANWQEGQANPNTSTILNANTGFGTQITGTGGATNGFDTSASNSPSMFGFNNNTNAWTTITNTNVNTLSAGVPYRILVRGDRSISLATNASASTPTTLRARGTLRTGNFTVTATVADATDKYTFLGNPYQAPVNMETVLSTATGINPNFIYVWNSNASARGAYETINVTTSDPKKFVQPGQAFFVRNTTTSPSVTFTEASKIVDEVDETIFRNNLASENNITHLKIKLFEANALSLGEIQADQLDVRFGNFENSVDDFDALKLVNPDEEMATVVDEIRCSYQQRNLPNIGEIIPINIKKYRHENYVFAIEVPTMQGIQIFLEDQYLNTFTAIAPDTVFLHEFSVQTGNEPSLNENRFRLVFEQIVLSNPDFATNGNIKIYPNPSNGNFNIRLPKHTYGQISIYNTLGQEIYNNKNIETEHLNVQLNKIPTGTYFVKAMLDNKTYQEQIIIE